MSLSNDSAEGSHTLKMIEHGLFERHFIDAINTDQIRRAINLLTKQLQATDGLGLCFSKVGDTLSQWRGYADDGYGMSIGFDEPTLSSWAKTAQLLMREVVYDLERTRDDLAPIVDAILRHVPKGAFEAHPMRNALAMTEERFQQKLAERSAAIDAFFDDVSVAVAQNLYCYKNPAFNEEKEWRVLDLWVHATPMPPFDVHPARNALKPYRTFKIDPEFKRMITHVEIGPKNITPTAVVEHFLRLHQFEKVKVSRSKSTYR